MTRVDLRWRVALLIAVWVAVLVSAGLSQAQVTVTGRVVVGETGRSLEGATVILEPKPGTEAEARQAQSDAKGRFQWEGVPPGEYTVRIQAEGYLERTRGVTVGDEAVHLALSVITTPDLQGRILSPDGQPLPRAQVALRAEIRPPGSPHGYGERWRVKTDDEGRFRLRVRRFGKWQLTAFAKGAGYGMADPFTVRQGEVPPELTVALKPTSTVSGRVVVEGTDQPVAAAQVGCHGRGPMMESGGDSTDETGLDGAFTVADLTPGNYWVSVRADGFRPGHAEVKVGEGEHVRDVVIELTPGISVSGRVFAPDGQTPLANARVTSNQGQGTETNAEGRFILENLPAGSCRLTIIAEGFEPLWHQFEVVKGEQAEELKLAMKGRGGRITGRVVDVDAGEPVTGAVVAAIKPDEHDPTGVPHEVEHYDVELFNAMGVPRDSPMRTETKADGTYELRHIPAETYGVAVIRGRGLNLWLPGVEVREGETTADVNFEVRQKMPGVLRVRVMLPDGRPLANTQVRSSVEHPNGSSGGGMDTDRDGYLHVRLRNPGTYAIQVTREGYMPAVAELEVEDVKGSPEMTVTLEPVPPGGPPMGSISGRVFMPDGTTPAKGITVAPFTKDAFFPGANAGYSTGGVRYRMSHQLGVETDADGSFTVEGLPPGTYGVCALLRKLGARPDAEIPAELVHVLPAASELVEVKDGEVTGDVRIVLGQAGSLVVTVTNAETGQPVANAHLSCRAMGETAELAFLEFTPDAMTDETGKGRVSGAAPGPSRVIVFAQGFEPFMRRDVVVEAGKETAIEVKLEPAGE